MLALAEYIWLDGNKPTQMLRSKTRVVPLPDSREVRADDLPDWSFDGSSTNQADGSDSDLILRPVRVVDDPLRGEGAFLVLCEVENPDGTAHGSNSRAELRSALSSIDGDDPWVGFEQEYTLLQGDRPLGFPENGFPAPQGPYYCGVGSDRVFGRPLVEAHADACMRAGLMLYGINAEVMPGQWEFQIGYRGRSAESADPLRVSDDLTMARWLLHRMAEDYGVVPSFEVKPMQGDWNGAGAHTNFSTAAMRDPNGGISAIRDAIGKLETHHEAHVIEYGEGLEQRLTGLHETCSIDEFRGGVADRGASIRIPRPVEERGYGYLEDRRPGANCDPYRVCTLLVRSVCGATEVATNQEMVAA